MLFKGNSNFHSFSGLINRVLLHQSLTLSFSYSFNPTFELEERQESDKFAGHRKQSQAAL